jgi:hypothetical protein
LPNGGGTQKPSSNVVCSKLPGATAGRCANWNQCNPAGNTCRLEAIECSQEARCQVSCVAGPAFSTVVTAPRPRTAAPG